MVVARMRERFHSTFWRKVAVTSCFLFTGQNDRGSVVSRLAMVCLKKDGPRTLGYLKLQVVGNTCMRDVQTHANLPWHLELCRRLGPWAVDKFILDIKSEEELLLGLAKDAEVASIDDVIAHPLCGIQAVALHQLRVQQRGDGVALTSAHVDDRVDLRGDVGPSPVASCLQEMQQLSAGPYDGVVCGHGPGADGA